MNTETIGNFYGTKHKNKGMRKCNFVILYQSVDIIFVSIKTIRREQQNKAYRRRSGSFRRYRDAVARERQRGRWRAASLWETWPRMFHDESKSVGSTWLPYVADSHNRTDRGTSRGTWCRIWCSELRDVQRPIRSRRIRGNAPASAQQIRHIGKLYSTVCSIVCFIVLYVSDIPYPYVQ